MLIAIANLLISSSNFLFPVEEYHVNSTYIPSSLAYEVNRFVLNVSSDETWFYRTLREIDPEGAALGTYHKTDECKKEHSSSGPFMMIFGGLMLLGVGRTMPFSLGLPLMDDNVKKHNLPLYFACMFFVKILGPVVGLLVGSKLNEIYYTFDPPQGLTPLDPMWIGCWWLGFLIFGALLFFPSLILFLFPSDNLAEDDKVEKISVEEAKLNGTAGDVFYSPCQAGCPLSGANFTIYTKMDKGMPLTFTGCECSGTRDLAVSRDYCPTEHCNSQFHLFFMNQAIGAVFGGLSVVPGMLIVLRSVPPEHRSISLGFNGFLVSLLATLPSPVFWGKIFDLSCLMWQNVCSKTGACPIYDTDQLRIRLHVIYGGLRIFSLLSDIWVIYWAKGLKLVDEEEEPAKTNESDDDAQELKPLTDTTGKAEPLDTSLIEKPNGKESALED
ncbi:hypothetical protein GCK32_010740 [Trichostrongylus colubriformis]|uniref:Solute carrier organic anion transporter family member n=1 Tax=Trichostrongylus colubriformis TaxID=6319 RepID=A0AAN8FTY6_TRICO